MRGWDGGSGESVEKNLFLSEAWLRVMGAVGAVSAGVPVALTRGRIHVGQVRELGQSRWVVYGSWPEPSETDLNQLFDRARRAGALAVESRFNMARWPEKTIQAVGGEILEPFGTYVVDLTRDEERLWMGLKPTHRNKIRRAHAQGIEIRPELDPARFRSGLESAYARGGRHNPHSDGYFEALEHHLSPSTLKMSAWLNGAFQAGALIVFDSRRGYYLHGAVIDAPATGAANLLHWEVLRALKARGVAEYDLGGARLHTDDPRLRGIFQFKEHFGGVFEPCCFWRKIVHPWRHRLHRGLERARTWLG
ncbi:MAG: GNAT family N-acetyltransferase [Magnetococcales bacterium]|nr:GNAT family N-acetyltransferase [Magnetococcales bacterium]